MARVIGLTGGIASGKSTVSAMLRDLGAVIIDADQIVRDLQRPGGEAFDEIVSAFGREVLSQDGTLDRGALGTRIFADPPARRRLNAIIHPRVRARIRHEVRRLQEILPREAVIILDVPLLLDTAPRDTFAMEGVIVVAADEATQIERLRQRTPMSVQEARNRLQAQRPLREKVAEADWVIQNTGSLEETRRQVEVLWTKLTKR